MFFALGRVAREGEVVRMRGKSEDLPSDEVIGALLGGAFGRKQSIVFVLPHFRFPCSFLIFYVG